MLTVIIKSATDSFEREINRNFSKTENVMVVTTESIVNNNKGLRKYLRIILWLKKFKKLNKNKMIKIIIFDNKAIFLICSIYFKYCYLWLWNTVPPILKQLIILKVCNFTKNVYTFDEKDCSKYGLKYNTQFCLPCSRHIKNELYSVYFVGLDKGRYSSIYHLYQYLAKNNVKVLFQVIADIESGIEYDKNITMNYFIDYSIVLNNVMKSNAVLDFSKEGQSGVTFRAMEALSYEKKIITNNVAYKDALFYNPKMVYIIENNSYIGLIDFLNADKVQYDVKSKDYYSIKKWISRFV